MAIESLERALEMFGTPLYVYHEIVHNRPVVERFRKRGVVFVDSVDEAPAGAVRLDTRHGGSRGGGGAQPAGQRRDVPASDQGPPGGGAVRSGGLHDPAYRP